MTSMEEKIKLLQKPLDSEDIELRIGHFMGTNGFCMLLAYKTARVDSERLDSVFPGAWGNSHSRDSKGILTATIRVWNHEINCWVERSDVGVESNTEKEKGEASDAFKRAGFKWGIGAELYNFPFIWINWNDYSEYNNKFTPKNFDNKSIKIDEYIVENAEVKKLKLTHKGTVIFEFGKNVKAPEKEKQEEAKHLPAIIIGVSAAVLAIAKIFF